MVSDQLLNSDFSCLLLEEASPSLCLVLPEPGAALRFSSMRCRCPGEPAARHRTWRQLGDPTETRRCLELGTCKSITSTHRPCHGWEPKEAPPPPQPGAGRCRGCCAVLCRWCCAGFASCSWQAPSTAAALFLGLTLPCSRAAG